MVKKAINVRRVFQCDEMDQRIDVSLLSQKERLDFRMVIHALNVQSCQSFCRIQNFMATQTENVSYPVCDHQFVNEDMVAQSPLEIMSGLRSYISEFDGSGGKVVSAFSSQGMLIDSISIDSAKIKNSIKDPFKDAQVKIGQSFDFSSHDVYVTTAKKDGNVISPIYMDSSRLASILGRNGFCYVNSNGFTSLCTFENQEEIICKLQKVDGLGVKAILTEEGFWLFLAPIPSQQKRQ